MEEDDFVSCKRSDNPILLAPKRPTKKCDDAIEDPPSLFSNASKNEDSFGISRLDSPPKEKITCPLCMKDLSQLNSVRRSLHTNQCLDGQQTVTNHQKAKEKHSLTIDCPVCRKPLEPGPFRSAHIKKCGKENNLAPSKLVEILDIQTKIVESNKKRGMTHTSAPVPIPKAVKPQKLKDEPKTKADEDLLLAKALSESMEYVNNPYGIPHNSPKFERVEDTRKNKKKRPRSYSIIQFAPHECQCKILTLLHERFITMFKTRKNKPIRDSVVEYDNRTNFFALQERKLVDKLLHLDNLAKDLYSLSDQSNKDFDFSLKCTDGTVNCHRMILEKRTRDITLTKNNVFEIDASSEIIQSWLSYVYAGAIEWSEDQNESVRRLGLKYGPEGVIIACKRMEKQNDDDIRETSFLRRIKSASSLVEKETVVKRKSVGSQYDEPLFLEEIEPYRNDLSNENVVQADLENKSVDCEDPLQGIHFDNSIVSIDSEITLVEDVRKRSPTITLRDSEEKECSIPISTEISSQNPPMVLDVDRSSSPLILENQVEQSSINTYYEPNYDFPMDDGCEIIENNMNDDIYKESFWQTDPVHDKEDTPKVSIESSPKSEEPQTSRRRSARLTQIRDSSDGKQNVDSFDDSQVFNCVRMEPVDSFDAHNFDSAHELPIQSPSTSFVQPLAQSTPLQPSLKRPKFGSNVKILKTSEITPMPNYDGMDDNDLKKELARHGLRPMGRKRAVEYLRNIYESVHPVIDPTTPTIRPLLKLDDGMVADQPLRKGKMHVERPKPAKRHMLFEENTPTKAAPEFIPSSPTSSDDGLGNQTLNDPQEEPMEESMIESTLPKDINSMTTSLLNWLRKPENEELYCHMLSLQPVMIDELHLKLTRSEDPASLIPKKSLGAILDRMGITFSLPQPTGGRRGMGAIKRKK